MSILWKKLCVFGENAVFLLSMGIVFFVLVLNVVFDSLTYNNWYPLIFRNHVMNIIALLIFVSLCLCVIITILRKGSDRFFKNSIILLNIFGLITKLFIVFAFENIPIADSWHVFNGANILFFTNDLGPLYVSGYFATYPQQLGIVSLLYPLVRLFRYDVQMIYVVQAVMMQLSIMFLTWSVYRLKTWKVAFLVSLMFTLFPPNSFVAFLVYGDLYALFFLSIAMMLYTYSLSKEGIVKLILWILMLLMIIIAYFARVSTNVYFIALIIMIILHHKFDIKYIMMIGILFISILYPMDLLVQQYDVKDVSLGEYAYPTNTWIRLGLGYSGFDHVTPGYHDMRLDEEFKQLRYDKAKMSEVNQEVIKNRILELSKPKEFIRFFGKKAIVLYTDPDFEMVTLTLPFRAVHSIDPYYDYSIQAAGAGKMDMLVRNEFGAFIQKNTSLIRFFEKVIYVLLLVMTLLTLGLLGRRNRFLQYCSLLIIGFFLLHMMIEIKSRYLFVFMNSMMFFITMYFPEVLDKLVAISVWNRGGKRK